MSNDINTHNTKGGGVILRKQIKTKWREKPSKVGKQQGVAQLTPALVKEAEEWSRKEKKARLG